VTYFKSGWNIFDAIVVVVSIAGVALDYGTTQNLTFMPLLRIMRVVRIFKLIPKAKGLRTLMQTLLWSLPALLNVGTSGWCCWGVLDDVPGLPAGANMTGAAVGARRLVQLLTQSWKQPGTPARRG
jgi:hypothetical protein